MVLQNSVKELKVVKAQEEKTYEYPPVGGSIYLCYAARACKKGVM